MASLNQLSQQTDFLKTPMAQSFQQQALGFIDIGARGGTHELVRPIANLTQVLAFEPDHEEFKALKKYQENQTEWASFIADENALYHTEGKFPLYLLSADTNHSLLEPNQEFTDRYNMEKWRKTGSALVNATNLDSLINKHYSHLSQMGEVIKIDTQGTEFEIIQGAKKTINDRSLCLITEVSFCELYKGQKLFSDVEQLLRTYGFSFYGFYPMRLQTRSKKLIDKRQQWTRERAFFADAVFFRDPFALNQSPLLDNPRAISVLICSALLLGFFDFALELGQQCWPHEQCKALEALIRTQSYRDPSQSIATMELVLQAAKSDPINANLYIGKYIDQQKAFSDYSEIILKERL